MKLLDLLQMTQSNRQPQQQSEGLGPIMQFLSQNRAPQMAPINMPDAPNYGAQIMAHGMQKQDREDQYAAHLQAKADMEQQQAEHWAGSGQQIATDPAVVELINSGDPQKVAYGLKLAEEEATKRIASQYNENATFAQYNQLMQEGSKESLAKAARMMEFKKAGGTNISLGDKTANDVVWMSPAQKQMAGLDPTQPYAINQKSGMPEAVKPNEFTDAQNKSTGYYNRMIEAEKLLDVEMAAGFETGSAKEAIANALPYGLGGLLRTPQGQRVRQAQEDWVRAKLRNESGANIPSDEMDREIQTYFPGLNETDPFIIAQKKKSREQGALQLLESTGGKRVGSSNSLVNKALDAEGVPEGHPLRAFANTIAGKESGGNANVHDSVDGAKGLMQVMPRTFNQIMPEGNIRDPLHNAIAGVRYLKQGWQETNGDPWGTAMFYHGGPGAKPNTKDGLGVSNAQYARDVIAKLQSGSQASVAKKPRDYNEARKQAAQPNSPVNKAAKERADAAMQRLRDKGLL